MKETDKIVEMICMRGCKSVNKVRRQLSNGENVVELATLSGKQLRLVKQELDSIMQVYENKKQLVSG